MTGSACTLDRLPVGRQGKVCLVEIYLAARFRGHGFHGSHMVKMAVGQQNGIYGQVSLPKESQNSLRPVAGIDHGAAAAVFDNIGIGLKCAKGQGVDIHNRSLRRKQCLPLEER